jgi:site-specific recombinase XerD
MRNRKQPLGALLESFFQQRLLAQRRASTATVAAYRDALKLLLLYASGRASKRPGQLSVADLDRPIVLGFLDHLEKVRRVSVRTRNARLTAIRSFFHHVAFEDPAALGVAQRILSIPGKRTVQPILNHLSRAQLRALLDVPDRRTSIGRRDYALLLFLGESGARVSEAIGVDAADLQLDAVPQVLLRGKGSKERVLPIKKATAAVLKILRAERGLGPLDHSPLFATRSGERLTRFGVSHLVRRCVATAKRNDRSLAELRVSPHTFRHTAAMGMLQSGVDLSVIRSWLGHVSLDTTHHYMEADTEMKRRALESCDTPRPRVTRYRPSDPILSLLESL